MEKQKSEDEQRLMSLLNIIEEGFEEFSSAFDEAIKILKEKQ